MRLEQEKRTRPRPRTRLCLTTVAVLTAWLVVRLRVRLQVVLPSKGRTAITLGAGIRVGINVDCLQMAYQVNLTAERGRTAAAEPLALEDRGLMGGIRDG